MAAAAGYDSSGAAADSGGGNGATMLRFFLSCDVPLAVRFRLECLVGDLLLPHCRRRQRQRAPLPLHGDGTSTAQQQQQRRMPGRGSAGQGRDDDRDGDGGGGGTETWQDALLGVDGGSHGDGNEEEEEEEDDDEGEQQLFVEAQVYVDGMAMGLPEISRHAKRVAGGGSGGGSGGRRKYKYVWEHDEWLYLPVKYCDLTSDSQLALTVWDASSPGGPTLVGGTTLRLFSKPSSSSSSSLATGGTSIAHTPGSTSDASPESLRHVERQHQQHQHPERQRQHQQKDAAGEAGGHWSPVSLLQQLVQQQQQLQQQHAMLKMGRFKLRLWEGCHADGSVDSKTPGKVPKGERGEADRLEHVVSKYDRGEVPRVAWLDHLAFKQIDSLLEQPEELPLQQQQQQQQVAAGPSSLSLLGASRRVEGGRSGRVGSGGAGAGSTGGGAASQQRHQRVLLFVELPTFDHPVAFQEMGGSVSFVPPLPPNNTVVRLWDPEADHQRHTPNPAELKQLKLTRVLMSSLARGAGSMDRDLKPNLKERKEIAAVLVQPPTRALTGGEAQLLWRFRFSLTSDKRALTKFLRCVDWSDAEEASQGTELMHKWAPIDTADALELLSPLFVSEQVRAYAVSVLERAGDEELQSYLLQLVHALRYERFDNSNLASFLIARGCHNFVLANFLHWYLRVERHDPLYASRYAAVHDRLLASLLQLGEEGEAMHDAMLRQSELDLTLCGIMLELKAVRGTAARKTERLRQLLASSSTELGHSLTSFGKPLALPLEPSIRTSGLVAEECSVFKSALHPIKLVFREHVDSASAVESRTAASTGAGAGSRASEGASHGVGAAADPGSGGGSSSSSSSRSIGSSSGSSNAGSSSGSGSGRERGKPARAAARLLRVIFKKGDDLRQDQLVIAMISLMDRLLKKESLDLRLTPYRVLATGTDQGYVEFIPSMPLAQVLAEHRSITRYLHQFHPDPNNPANPTGISPDCLDTFLRSCAGYCVIMYILGVGDRHLDNLLLCTDGRLFHIDFGFILGRDPKPFPPPMKLCKEMIDVMTMSHALPSSAAIAAPASAVGGGGAGGAAGTAATAGAAAAAVAAGVTGAGGAAAGGGEGSAGVALGAGSSASGGKWDSADYRRFRSYCCEAFNILRSHSRLILNLVYLMAHSSSIPDFASDHPDKVVLKVQQKFRLDLDDGAAVQFIQALIHESVSALFPQMVETIHRWSTYWR